MILLRFSQMEFNPVDIRKLANLLKEDVDSSSDDDLPHCKMGPGDIKAKSQVKIKVPSEEYEHTEAATNKKQDPKAIWDLDEVQAVPFCDDASYDPRARPEFDISYRQAVTSEDVFLQLGRKTSSTSSCEAMVVAVRLDGEQREDLDLNVTKHQVDLRSPLYRLSMPLPHPVDPSASSAEWHPDKSTLSLTLALTREMDFANF